MAQSLDLGDVGRDPDQNMSEILQRAQAYQIAQNFRLRRQIFNFALPGQDLPKI